MARSPKPSALAFDALTIEGALIAPAMLARIAAREAGEQKDADYATPKGLTLRDEISRWFRVGQALFKDLNALDRPSHKATIDFVAELLSTVFGFDGPEPTGQLGVWAAAGGRVPVVVVPPSDELDRPSAPLSVDGRRRSAASTLQDHLNAEDTALWGLCCNGERLRLMRDNASLTRPAYIEADLRRMFEAEAFADFAALWLLIHASRFGRSGAAVTDCPLEHWRDAGQKAGVAARDRLRDGFEAALLALGTGFLAEPANETLRQRVISGALPLPNYFGQLLRLVYRLIFLFAAEDRALLHPRDASTEARKLYAEGYSAVALREASARRSAWDRHRDRWDGLRITFGALSRGETKLALPALDGLFAHGSLPDLEAAHLSNRALMEAIWRLAWLRENGRPVPVNWRDMETEELGSVYEGLLELTPRLAEGGRAMVFAEGIETKGNARKTSGSYYTPDSLVQLLLDSALDPVLDRVEAEADDKGTALLGVTVIDPACGSGHFLLAAARRIATRVAKARASGLASTDDYRHALRDVVRSCIHGVDRNPMAVELAKVALWIETVDPGKPLGFLDANIRCGDTLLGVFDLRVLDQGIPDAAYKPLSGDDRDAARIAGKVNRGQRANARQGDLLAALSADALARQAQAVLSMPEDDVAGVQTKARAYAKLRGEAGWGARKLACDLYIAAFLRTKAFRTDGLARAQTPDRVPTSLDVRTAVSGGQADPRTTAMAAELAEQAQAFHWPLEFPAEMAAGGFDVVLGNPPWERIKLQEQEFFASLAPEIAEAPNADARGRMIAALASAPDGSHDRKLFDAFEQSKRTAEASSTFARVPGSEGGRFPLAGRGDVNTYALFSELFFRLVSTRGRAGLIVPTGIATDATTAPFFAALIQGKHLVSLHDFQTGLGYFDRIGHARFKFCLLTMSRRPKEVDLTEFSFFARTIDEYRDESRHFTMSAQEIAEINPNTLTAPNFRTRFDADLTANIHRRVPVLVNETKEVGGNPWGISFMTMFHMANDSGIFRTAAQLSDAGLIRDGTDWVDAAPGTPSITRWVPLYEAKLIHQLDHRWATYDGPESRDVTLAEKADARFEPTFRYWVQAADVEERLVDEESDSRSWVRDWLMGWRDIARATDERTVIATVFPRVGANHKTPLFFTEEPPRLAAALLANLSALTQDYVARQKIGGTSLTYSYVKQFSLLPPSFYKVADLEFIVSRLLELTYTSWSLRPFARDLDYDGPPFTWDEQRRAVLRAELDAWYARAYGLGRDELRYVLDPADVMGAEYPSETFRVLKANEIRRYGEYRTRRLVLEAWDAQEVTPAREVLEPSSLASGAWGRPPGGDLSAATEAQLAAILKALAGPTPMRTVRLAAVFALEPRLLTTHLHGQDRQTWMRLVGTEANIVGGATPFAPRIDQAWASAVRQLRGAGALVVDPGAQTWAAGQGLDAYETASWPDGRARFVLQAISSMSFDDLLAGLPAADQDWMKAIAA